jgi:O-antigen/teichoic acid export membrane protein
MIGQRILAALLTVLAFALIIAIARAVFRYLGHPGYGWPVGVGFCLIMVVAFFMQGRGEAR